MTVAHASEIGTVNVERLVHCPFSLAVDFGDAAFAELERPGGGLRVRFRALALPFPGAFVRRVSVHSRRQNDATEAGRSHDEISFNWDAQSPFLPNLSGELRFRIESSQTRILLSGRYVPPFGSFGKLFDRSFGHRLATATAEDLVARLSRHLEARWALEQRS